MKKLNTGIFLAILLIVTGALLIGGTSHALFTHTAESTDNVFLSGNLSVRIDREHGSGYFDISNLLPGDRGSNTITISNPGNLTLSYRIGLTLTGKLAEGLHPLEITIRDAEGNPISPNSQRPLAPDGEEKLTIIWQMPLEAGNEYQGKTAQMSVSVQASQDPGLASVNQ